MSDYVLGVLSPHRPSFQWVSSPTLSSPVLTKVAGSEVVAVDREGRTSVVVPSTLSLPPMAPPAGVGEKNVVYRTLAVVKGEGRVGVRVGRGEGVVDRMAEYSVVDAGGGGLDVLMAVDARPVYRHSHLGPYAVVEGGVGVWVAGGVDLRKAVWRPGGASSPMVAVVDANRNIGLIDVGKDASKVVEWVTEDGDPLEVANGVPDWVYEEEVYSTDVTLWWSPDGRMLAYLRFNETGTPITGFDRYSVGNPYPERHEFSYPVPGTSPSEVTLWVYDVDSGVARMVDVLVAGSSYRDQYIVRVQWAGDRSDTLLVRVVDRMQQKRVLVRVTVPSLDVSTVSVVTSKAWIDVHNSLFVFPSSSSLGKVGAFVDLVPRGDEMVAGVFKMDGTTPADAPLAWLGPLVSVKGISSDGSTVVGVAATRAQSRALVAKTGLSATSPSGETTGFIELASGWASGSVSPDGSMYVQVSSGPRNPPKYALKVVGNWGQDADPGIVLEGNEEVKEALGKYALATREEIEVPASPSGMSLVNNGYMLKPPGFDPSRRYPVLMYQYSGPGSQLVTDAYSASSWLMALASSEDMIVVCVDGVGTGGRGLEYLHATYLQLGVRELEDQIAAAEYVQSLPYVDESRVGLFGWSFGGFMAASAMVDVRTQGVYSAIISVAPVTDWRLYDSVYTERYMQTPERNEEGYDKTSVVESVIQRGRGGWEDRPFLLMAGLADDNVRYVNTAQLGLELVRAGVQFDGFAYVNQAHGIAWDGAHEHVYVKMTKWLGRNL